MKVYRLTGQGFGQPIQLTVEAHDQLTSPLLPKWELLLQDLFQ